VYFFRKHLSKCVLTLLNFNCFDVQVTIASQHIPSMCAVSPLPSDDDISSLHHHQRSAAGHHGGSRSGTVSPVAAATVISGGVGVRINLRMDDAGDDVVVKTDDDLDAEVRASLTPDDASPSSSGRTRTGGKDSQEAALVATALVESRKQQEDETEPGKLVSITPDIVKPLKEVKNNEDDNDQPTDERHSEHDGDTAADGGPAAADISPGASPGGGLLLKGGSSGRLPDMLTHTPDGQQGQGRNAAAAGVPAVMGVALTEVAVKGKDETEITLAKTAGKVPYLPLLHLVHCVILSVLLQNIAFMFCNVSHGSSFSLSFSKMNYVLQGSGWFFTRACCSEPIISAIPRSRWFYCSL